MSGALQLNQFDETDSVQSSLESPVNDEIRSSKMTGNQEDVVIREVDEESAAASKVECAESSSTTQTTKEAQVSTEDLREPSPKKPSRKEARGKGTQTFSPGPSRPPFRIPEFRWSYVHQRLLSDLLSSIEGDLHTWRK